jgi:hypothetical protein
MSDDHAEGILSVDKKTRIRAHGLRRRAPRHVLQFCPHSIRRSNVSPAMAAGVTDRLWEMSDLVDMIEAFEAETGCLIRHHSCFSFGCGSRALMDGPNE